MAGNYFPEKDTDFNIWLSNFVTVANANLATLGLVAGDITPISTNQALFTTNLTDVEAKKAALANAVETKDVTKDLTIQKLRLAVNKIQANPAVPVALKAQLGISTNEGGQYPSHPNPPTDLIAMIMPDGSVELKWKRNGNSPSIMFAIEGQFGNSTDWTLINVITKLRYNHTGLTPGMLAKFRIKAKNNEFTSSPSNIGVVNAGGTV